MGGVVLFFQAEDGIRDVAVTGVQTCALPIYRPIYLIDGSSPAYVHAYWYAAVEGRDRAQFVHLEDESAPYGAIAISSAQKCGDCEVIKKSGEYIVYRALWPTVTVPFRKRK